MVTERTLTWPVGKKPLGPPSISTNLSRASVALTAGQGWLVRHVPSISRAATPATRTFGPSAHQIGPSPSQTATGVQANARPAATTEERMSIIRTQLRRHRGLNAARSLDPRPSQGLLQPLAPRYSFERMHRRLAAPGSGFGGLQPLNYDGNGNRPSCGCYGNLEH